LSRPWGAFTTNSVSFSGSGRTSAAFTFVNPRRLLRVDAYNGGASTATVTLSCVGQPLAQVSVGPGQVRTIATDWTAACGSVTITSSNGWDTNFDNLQLD
jgi:hypothetical protein